jgi:hypothetical protein
MSKRTRSLEPQRTRSEFDASPGRLQFIVADNDIPDVNNGDATMLAFSYAAPAVSSVKLPGRARFPSRDRWDS